MSAAHPPTPLTASIAERVETQATPALFAGSAQRQRRFWEYFTAHIRNPNTRHAYLSATHRFADWCQAHGIALAQVEPMLVAAYIEELSQTYAPATVKQHLAALRTLFDWLVVGQAMTFNPAAAVRGPSYVSKTGKTPVLSAAETRQLLESIDTTTAVGLRDRALIALMVYSFARITAALRMTVADYYHQGKRSFIRLQHEKGGRYNKVPAHHAVQIYLDAYIEAAGIADDRKGPLFRASDKSRRRDTLNRTRLGRGGALDMIKRRAKNAGLPSELCNHSFRGTGITEYLRGGGTLENAARIAGHASTRTTQLYDRVREELTLDEIERIHI